MSRFFPHASYAEDQPLSRTILITHVLTRAVATGSIVGTAIVGVQQLVPRWRAPSSTLAVRSLLLTASTSTLVTMGLTAVATAVRMKGREEIEWRDRSWRLMENPGQLECDDWTYAGMGVAVLLAASKRGHVRSLGLGWRGVVGAAGLGSVGGTIGYMGWRYGVKGGKFPEKKEAL